MSLVRRCILIFHGVTRRADGTMALVGWNLVMEKGDGYEKELTLQLPWEHGQAFVKRQTVDEQHANPWRTWKQMGRPRFPDRASIETIRQASTPLYRTFNLDRVDGVLTLQLTLTKNEVTLVEILPVHEEEQPYAGLDDSLITSYS